MPYFALNILLGVLFIGESVPLANATGPTNSKHYRSLELTPYWGLTCGLVARVTSLFAVAHFAQELLFAFLSWHLPQPYCRQVNEGMNPNNFGRLMAYLTLVYKIADSYEEEIVREAVQRTVENLKHIDLENI